MTLLTFTKAKSDDLHTILTLFTGAAQAMKDKQINHWRHWLEIDESRIGQVKTSIDNGEFFLVYEEDTHIGMFKIMDADPEYWGERSEVARYVHALVVNPRFKGRNLGERILDQISADLKAKQIDLFRLDCNANNPWLCQYYENNGFVKVGVKEMPWSTNNLYEKVIFREVSNKS
ncbi:MAG: GNAT family N-acetyltransferase [Saprospiraceae bacterium]|nr:GNAT family N-acetyltransferase [Saprospiraceae bacterium]